MSRRRNGCGSCGCGNSNCSGGCGENLSCENIVPASPTPFYNCADVCVEDHCQTVVRASYAAAITVKHSFNMPACDGSVELKISGLITVAVGAYIWNASVGYLEVVAFNPATGIITAQNNCNTGNASPGATFPACTLFTVTDPPASSVEPDSGIFVAIDFTAPAVGDCLLITVTGVTGITAGGSVQIGGGTYRVSEVNSSTTITICNDGAGLVEGTSVIAKNGAGQYQYPVTLITVSPCEQDPVQEGSLVICDGGIQKIATGDAVGQVWALQNVETGEGSYVTLSVQERTCTLIGCCLVLTPGTLQYTITVEDSSQFTVGMVLQIGTRDDRWTIDAIPDSTHIIATTDTNPVAITTIPEGTTLCAIDCCEDLQIQIDELKCAEQVIFGDIPQLGPSIQTITLTPDDEDGGSFATTLSAAVKVINLALLFPDCDPETQITAIAHLSVGTLNTWIPDTLTIPDAGGTFPAPMAWYEEIGFAWDTGNFPAGGKAGKLVRTHTTQDYKTGGFPTVANPTALFSEVLSPGVNYPMDYRQEDVEITALVTAADTITLSMFYLAVLGSGYAVNLATPLDLGDFRYLVTGWVEIFRSA